LNDPVSAQAARGHSITPVSEHGLIPVHNREL
jgi:hypothetical protein